MRIHPVDLAIVIAYLLGVTALGMRFRRGQQSVTDYFLGGRTAPWWALAFSIVATETSTLTIIGTPAISSGGEPPCPPSSFFSPICPPLSLPPSLPRPSLPP